ncbi:hypothetical protein M407DRAFT_26957 [Tulasnella calospora MUT 4182]|uniref:Uncharacterized protein n=1 Tax=Tulasnella calospora MUT 4182 TaxID=1051891 RepID=A0A0C3Q417_9AGAM|nr:hypothetical protein M407DRAFT_26957 [Tulasnella calospora MUT 4182]
MKLSALYLSTFAFIPSFISAATIPNLASHKEALAKRGGEVNYLSNCRHWKADLSSFYTVSHILWYSNVDNSQSGHDAPNSLSNEYRDWAAGGDYLHWEEQQQNIYFPDSGTTVQTHIASDAQSRDFTAYAGWAQRTSDGKVFNCYKDNDRVLTNLWGENSEGGYVLECHARYWCV